jgi:hypothetical protein
MQHLMADLVIVHSHLIKCCGCATNDGIKVPRVLEFTLLRGEHISQTAPATEFPHPLDRDNLAGKPTLELPALWYRD